MSVLGKIKLVVIGVAALALLVGVSAVFLFGKGKVHVLAPYDYPVEVEIDGKRAVSMKEGSHRKFELSRGEHDIRIIDADTEDSITHKVTISSGFTDLLVPASEDQCFVLMDVSKSHYERTFHIGSPPLPTIKQRITTRGPVDVPGNTYFSEDSLPRKIKSSSRPKLLEEVACDEMEGVSDQELLTEVLGFGEDDVDLDKMEDELSDLEDELVAEE